MKQETKDCFENMSDNDLVILFRKNNPKAQEVLIRRYKSLAAEKAKKYYIMGGDNEDVVQEGMIGIFKAIRDYDVDKGASFKTFAEICITRQILSAIEVANRYKHKILNDAISLNSINVIDVEGKKDYILEQVVKGCGADPEMEIIVSDLLSSLVNREPPIFSKMEKSILKLLLQGMNYQEIAKKLNKSPKSIDNGVQRLKKKIETYLFNE